MIEWSEPQRMLRTAVRQFVEREIAPNLDQLEHGDTPPYDTLRKFLKTFGIDAMAKQRFESELAKDRAQLAGEPPAQKDEQDPATAEMMRGEETAMRMIPTIELCRYCPGMVTAMGVSIEPFDHTRIVFFPASHKQPLLGKLRLWVKNDDLAGRITLF